MINRHRLLAAFLFLLTPFSSGASPLIADLSTYRINIDSSFSGTRIFLFGARFESGDLVVVIRGPSKNYIIRKKEEFGGIWVNSERMRLFNVPDFYVVSTSKALESMHQEDTFRQLGIGIDGLAPGAKQLTETPRTAPFLDAFLRYQFNRRLYRQDTSAVRFMGETLFKTVIEFPDNIPQGDYTAEIYLVSNGEVLGMQSIPLRVVKSGLDAYIAQGAHEHPIFYGFSAVIIALSAGWFAGRLFEKM